MEIQPPDGGDWPSRPVDIRDIDPVLLDRYLAGEASDAERAHIETLASAHPAVRDGLTRLRDAVGGAQEGVGAEMGAEALAARARAIRELGDAGRGRQAGARRDVRVVPLRPVAGGAARAVGNGWWTGPAVAAAIVVAVGMGIVIGWGRRSGYTVGPMREYVTAPGERRNVTLADGTQFELAPASRLRVPVLYGRMGRDVELEGEAFFQVVHNDARPFRVRAKGATTIDVGTAFDVAAYGSDSIVRVVVAEGRVRVGARDLLGAGDVAAVAADGRRLALTHEDDLSAYIGWTRNELTFRDTPLRDVAPVLARWYGVTITVTDTTLGRQLVRATFNMQSMTEVLTSVSSAVGAHYTQQGRVILIAPDHLSSR
jgi:transmembrane sensor